MENNSPYYCPECGTHFIQGDWNYNYDTANLDFECPMCGWCGTENEVEVYDTELSLA